MPRRILRACALAVLVLAASCKDSTGARPVPASLQFAESDPVVEVGAQKRLEVTAADDRGRPIADASLRFASSRPDLLEVDSLTGVMTGKAPGSAEVTVTAGPATAAVAVTVNPQGGITVASLALVSADSTALSFGEWPGTVSVPVTVRNAAGVSLCGLVPVRVEVADSAIATAAYTAAAGGACTVSVKARSVGSTVLRVIAGARADSLALRVTPTHYVWSLRRSVPKVAGALYRWEVWVTTTEGVGVPGVPVTFWYRDRVTTPFEGPSVYDTVRTDGAGIAALERRLPTSTYFTSSSFSSSAGSFRSSSPGGIVDFVGQFPDGVPFSGGDHENIVPGPPVSMEFLLYECVYRKTPFDESRCEGRNVDVSTTVRLVDRTCPDGSRVFQSLVALTRDAWGNASNQAPRMNTLPASERELVFSSESISGRSASGYRGSKVMSGSLLTNQDSALARVSHPWFPVVWVNVVRGTLPCP